MGIYAAWGSVDVQDDLAAVDEADRPWPGRPESPRVGGWSYGGMSTNYLIASTTRFKAAVSGASISNVLAGYGTDQYIRDYEYELGSPWAHPEVWAKLSYPFLHADKIKTPTLVSLRRKRLQRAAAQQRADVSGSANVRRADPVGDLSGAVPRDQEAELHSRSLPALSWYGNIWPVMWQMRGRRLVFSA